MTTTAISETVSEKPKRGRPRKLGDNTLQSFAAYYPDVKTRRGKQNKAYELLAMRTFLDVLEANPEEARRWEWIGVLRDGSGGRAYKCVLMTALGRLGDDALIIKAADLICERKLNGPRAINFIRNLQPWRRKDASAIDLTVAIGKTVDGYIGKHPDTTWQQVKAALENVLETISELEDDGR